MKDFEGKTHYPIDLESLPTGWSPAFVGDICADMQAGFASGQHNSAGTGVPHLRPMNIDRAGRLDMAVVKSVAADVDARRLSRGDVLFNNTNSSILVGKTAAVSRDDELAFSNHMTRLRPSPGIDHEYLAHHLHYLWMGGYFLHRCSKHVNQASISTDTLAESVPVAVPPSREQRKIVEAVDSHLARLDDAKACLERAQAKLKAYRAAVLKTALEGRLVPTEAFLARAAKRDYEPAETLLARILKERRRRWEETELVRLKRRGKTPSSDKWKGKYEEPILSSSLALTELPEGWTWAAACMVGDVQLGRQRAPIHHHGSHMRPYLRVANVFEDRIDTDDVMRMNFSPQEFEIFRLTFGDILLNEGQSPHLIGRPAMYRDEVTGACFQNTLIRFRACPQVDPRYALVVFRAQLHARRYMRIAQITTNIAHLGAGRFAEIEFPLPPTEEQIRIADEVERLMSIANSIESSLSREQSRATRLRQSILKWAFEGTLVDQDSTDEPATTLLTRIKAERAARGTTRNGRGRTARGPA